MRTGESQVARQAIAWTVGIGLVLLSVGAAFCAIFYAWIDVAAPGHARMNHAMGVICMWAVPTSLVGAVIIPRLILRRPIPGAAGSG